MLLLIAGLVLFIGFHSIRLVAPGLRTAMIERFGMTGWKAVHSLISLLMLVLLIYGFGVARSDTPVLWYPPVWTRHIALTLMIFATICLFAAAFPAGYIRTRTRFPLIVAVKIWAFAHLVANGELSSILLFAAFLAWAVVLRIGLGRAVRRGELAYPVFVSARYDIMAVVLGLALWAAMIFGLHEWLIGVPPLVF